MLNIFYQVSFEIDYDTLKKIYRDAEHILSSKFLNADYSNLFFVKYVDGVYATASDGRRLIWEWVENVEINTNFVSIAYSYLKKILAYKFKTLKLYELSNIYYALADNFLTSYDKRDVYKYEYIVLNDFKYDYVFKVDTKNFVQAISSFCDNYLSIEFDGTKLKVDKNYVDVEIESIENNEGFEFEVYYKFIYDFLKSILNKYKSFKINYTPIKPLLIETSDFKYYIATK